MMSICFLGSSGNWVDLANISNNNGSCYSDVFPVMEVDPSIFSSSTFLLWSTGETTENITITPTETTEYWVDVTTNGVTCREYITINVINPEITASATEICAGESVVLTVFGDENSSYLWSTGETGSLQETLVDEYSLVTNTVSQNTFSVIFRY